MHPRGWNLAMLSGSRLRMLLHPYRQNGEAVEEIWLQKNDSEKRHPE
jgi:hypothetical protein